MHVIIFYLTIYVKWKEVILLENKVNFEFLCEQKVPPDIAFIVLRRAAKKEAVAKRDNEKLTYKPTANNLGKKPNSAHNHHCTVEISSKKANSLSQATYEHGKARKEYLGCKVIFDRYLIIYAGVPEKYNNFYYVDMKNRNKPEIFFGPLDKKGQHIGHYIVDLLDGTVYHIQEV